MNNSIIKESTYNADRDDEDEFHFIGIPIAGENKGDSEDSWKAKYWGITQAIAARVNRKKPRRIVIRLPHSISKQLKIFKRIEILGHNSSDSGESEHEEASPDCYPSVRGDAMLRCLTCADRVQDTGRRSAYRDREKTRHGKMISTMAQLKNCCLGGLRVRQRGRENNDLVIASPRPLFSPFSYLNQLSLSRDIYLPITLID
jgi:hypothetical protein